MVKSSLVAEANPIFLTVPTWSRVPKRSFCNTDVAGREKRLLVMSQTPHTLAVLIEM